MTPVHITAGGTGLAGVGVVMSLVGAALVVVPALVVARFGPSAARSIREG